MAVRWGTNLPGPFFVSWGKAPSERHRSATLAVGYAFWQLFLWTTLGAIWLIWVTLVLLYVGIRALVNAIRDSHRSVGRHDGRLRPGAAAPTSTTTSVSEPIAQWSDRQ